jgi:hypothetical protein
MLEISTTKELVEFEYPNVVLLIDGHTVANQTQSVQHTFNTISRSYDKKTVTCQANHDSKIQKVTMQYINIL